MMSPQTDPHHPGSFSNTVSSGSGSSVDPSSDQQFSEIDEYEIKNGNGTRNSINDGFVPKKSVDSILASELNKLTFQEREVLNDEVHGLNIDKKYIEQTGAVEETPDVLSKSLNDMQTELDRLCLTEGSVGGSAYGFKRSQELYGSTPDGTVFNTADFRLMFLRCERFDVGKAAKRLCAYAEVLLEVYGDFALQRHIRLSDLDEDEVNYIKEGYSIIFPGRDRAGRRVYAHFAREDGLNVRSRLRIPHYIFMSMIMDDVESQRKGIVVVMWMHNLKKYDMNDFIRRGITQGRGTRSFPVRFGSGHYCFPSLQTSKNLAFAHVVSRIVGQVQPRIRIHTGSRVECAYALESFGISSKMFPLDVGTNKVDLTQHMRWFNLRVARDESPTGLKHIIECPNHSDILFGRGQIVMNHPGNTMFRNFIHCNLEVYSNIQSKKESTQWTWSVVRKLKSENGARFLKEERVNSKITAWVEVSNEVARSKVRIAFRDARTRQAKTAGKDGNVKGTNTKSNGHGKLAEPALISSSSLSKRKNGNMTPSDDFFPLSASSGHYPQQQYDENGLNNVLNFDDIKAFQPFHDINSNLNSLNDNLTQLNSNLSALVYQQQVTNSSTSEFLGMDGTNAKRQRVDSNNNCFDCGFNCL